MHRIVPSHTYDIILSYKYDIVLLNMYPRRTKFPSFDSEDKIHHLCIA
jgi:hypothetical protein